MTKLRVRWTYLTCDPYRNVWRCRGGKEKKLNNQMFLFTMFCVKQQKKLPLKYFLRSDDVSSVHIERIYYLKLMLLFYSFAPRAFHPMIYRFLFYLRHPLYLLDSVRILLMKSLNAARQLSSWSYIFYAWKLSWIYKYVTYLVRTFSSCESPCIILYIFTILYDPEVHSLVQRRLAGSPRFTWGLRYHLLWALPKPFSLLQNEI